MKAIRATLVLLALLPVAACDDPFGPRVWDATPDTATIWSASRLELIDQPSAYDFTYDPTRAVRIETPGATQNWDVVLIDHNGSLALAPASYFAGQSTRAAISVQGSTTLAAVVRAPGDTASYTRQPVPLRLGEVYVVRTRVQVCESGIGTGTRYAKITPVAIDETAGSFTFALVRNPYCDDRSLVPPEDD